MSSTKRAKITAKKKDVPMAAVGRTKAELQEFVEGIRRESAASVKCIQRFRNRLLAFLERELSRPDAIVDELLMDSFQFAHHVCDEGSLNEKAYNQDLFAFDIQLSSDMRQPLIRLTASACGYI